MIARLWSARTTRDPNAYPEIFRTEVLAELSRVPGWHGAYLLARGQTEFVALTLFDSLDAIRHFADGERANVSRQARGVLDDIDEYARHYTVLVRPAPSGPDPVPGRST